MVDIKKRWTNKWKCWEENELWYPLDAILKNNPSIKTVFIGGKGRHAVLLLYEKQVHVNDSEDELKLIVKAIHDMKLKGTDVIYLLTWKTIGSVFSKDDYVLDSFGIDTDALSVDMEYYLNNENSCVALNVGSSWEDIPNQVIIPLDHPSYDYHDIRAHQLLQVIIDSILHEEAHLIGIDDEDEAESWACKSTRY